MFVARWIVCFWSVSDHLMGDSENKLLPCDPPHLQKMLLYHPIPSPPPSPPPSPSSPRYLRHVACSTRTPLLVSLLLQLLLGAASVCLLPPLLLGSSFIGSSAAAAVGGAWALAAAPALAAVLTLGPGGFAEHRQLLLSALHVLRCGWGGGRGGDEGYHTLQ